MKKFIGTLFVLFVLVFTGFKLGLFYPKLIPTAMRLTTKIVTQEQQLDSTCWSTVRVMEFHQANMPLTYFAMTLKIEAMKTLLWNIWQSASDNNASFSENLLHIIGQENAHWLNPITDQTESMTLIENQQFHYHRLTEHFRYLLSILFDIGNENLDPTILKELSVSNIQQLATISTHLNTKLLHIAKESAINNHHPKITKKDIQFAYKEIRRELNLSTITIPNKKTSFLYLFWLKKISSNITKNKINALMKYNDTVWQQPLTSEYQAKLLSQIFKLPVDQEEINLLKQRFIEHLNFLLFPIDSLRVDTHQSSEINKEDINKTDFAYQIVTFEDEFNHLLKTLPFKLLKNGDVEVAMQLEPAKDDLKLIKIRHYTLDGIRDTIMHWDTIKEIQTSYRAAIMDPFALELLAERISEFYAIYFTLAKEMSISIFDLLTKYPNYGKKFHQINNIELKWTIKNNIQAKPYFKNNQTIKTPIDKKIKNNKGYYSGISSVDMNDDGRIDLIIPQDNQLTIHLNTPNGFSAPVFTYPSDERLSAVFAIDFNQDYRLDLVALSPKKITFIEQSSPLNFEEKQQIPLTNAFTMCINDIDNDGDLDIYVTQIMDDQPSIDGRNAAPNKLIINNNNTFNMISAPTIESTGVGLACSIIDINHDGLKDIIVINDFGKDELFIQKNNLVFIDKARHYKFDDAGSGMNLSIIDFNGDKFWDIYITMIDMFNKQLSFQLPDENSLVDRSDKIINTSTFLIGNQLYIGKNQTFERKTHEIFEPGLKGWGWGTSFFDYDNNTFSDFYITNGRYNSNEQTKNIQKNIFMINKNNTFLYSHSTSEESGPLNSRAVAAADINNDGKMDLILRNTNNVNLFKNISDNKNHWIKIKLQGHPINTHAIGSTIEVITKNKKQKKIILAETGYLTQEPYIKHFGLGKAPIEQIKITWPNNTVSTIESPKPNQLITIKEL